jgi:hypothetical protein
VVTSRRLVCRLARMVHMFRLFRMSRCWACCRTCRDKLCDPSASSRLDLAC